MFLIKGTKRTFDPDFLNLVKEGKSEEVYSTAKIYHSQTEKWVDSKGNHLLHEAAKYNHTELIKRLMYFGSEQFTIKNSSGMTPLIIAIIHKNYEVAKILYETHIDSLYNERAIDPDESFVDWTLTRLNKELIHELVPNLKKKKFTSEFIGEVLAQISTDASACAIVSYRDRIMTKSFFRTTTQVIILFAMARAIDIIIDTHDYQQILEILRNPPRIEDDENIYYLFCINIIRKICVLHNSISGRKFLKSIFTLDVFNTEDSLQYLESALKMFDYKQLKVFLKYNFHSIVKAQYGRDLLVSFFGNGIRPNSLLTDDQIDIHGRGYKNQTSLHYATANNLVDNAKWLLERGADPNAFDDDGCTPLMVALVCSYRLEDCVKLLLLFGANLRLVSDSFSADSTKNYYYFEHFVDANRYVVAQILIYEAMGRSIEELKRFVGSWSDYELDRFLREGRQQLKELKERKIRHDEKDQSNFTVFTIIAKKPERIARYVSEDDVRDIFKFVERNGKMLIPYYRELLKKNADDIREIHGYRKKAIRVVSEFMGIADENHLVVHKIVDYLSVHDLKKFSIEQSDGSTLRSKVKRFFKLEN